MEEVNTVAKIVSQLLASGKWTNKEGVTTSLTKNDILIVAPYNAQVSALADKLPGMRIGTVDKFQGQEAPVVIYSMAASTVEEAPRGISFLFNPNRLNVATSRAMSACILVASPKLFDADCRSIDQMKSTNSLCTFKEIAILVNVT
jgi:superfamily I DNA and/or RNA helicase